MNKKSEASQLLMDFCAMVDTEFGTKVKFVRSDYEYEFTSKPINKLYREKGNIDQTTCVDTQQNSRAERKHCRILK